MATSVNIGNQILTFSYGEPALSIRWNRLNYKLHTPGIYDGGEIEIVDGETARITPFTCYIVDNPSIVGVRIQTFDPIDLDVSDTSKPYICIRFNWLQQSANYAEISTFEYSEIGNDFLVIGKCEYSGLDAFNNVDYSYRDEITEKGVLSSLPFRVKSDPMESNEVSINGGVLLTTEERVEVANQSIVIPDTTDGRYDFLFFNNETGNIEVFQGDDSASPSMPSYSGRVVIAEIRRIGTRTTVKGSEITNVDPDIELTALTGVTSDSDGFVEISTLDPSRIVSTNASNKLESVEDFSQWFTGASGIIITDNADGTVTLDFDDIVSMTTLQVDILQANLSPHINVLQSLLLSPHEGLTRILQITDGIVEPVFDLSDWVFSTNDNLIVEDYYGEGKLLLTVPFDLELSSIDEVYIGDGVRFKSNVIFEKDVAILGDATTIDTETLTIEDNLILINKGESGSGVTKGFAGLLVDRGPYDDNYFLGFDEVRNAFTLGEISEETLAQIATTQIVATREDAPEENSIPFWNDVEKRFDTNSDLNIVGTSLNIPYSLNIEGTNKEFGMFYRGTTDPNQTDRLNYDGNFHAFTVVAHNGIQLGMSDHEIAGTLRWNTSLEQFEGYDGTEWGLIAGGAGIEETYIAKEGLLSGQVVALEEVYVVDWDNDWQSITSSNSASISAGDSGGVWVSATKVGQWFRSTDDGLTWNDISSEISILSPRIENDKNGEWLASRIGASSDLWYSINNGATWSSTSMAAIGNLHDFDSNRNGSWVVCGTTNVALSTTGADGTFNNIGDTLTYEDGFYAVANTVDDASWLVSTWNSDGAGSEILYRTSDNGANWSDISANYPYDNVYFMRASGNLVLAAGWNSDEIAVSNDEGDNWTDVSSQFQSGTLVSDIYVNRETSEMFVAGSVSTNRKLYYSHDMGVTWEVILEESNTMELSMNENSRVLIATTAGGNNYRRIEVSDPNPVSRAIIASKDEAQRRAVVGIAATDSAATEEVEIITMGTVYYPDGDLFPGLPVYLGNNGSILQATDSILSNEPVIFIGFASSPNTINVDIQAYDIYFEEGIEEKTIEKIEDISYVNSLYSADIIKNSMFFVNHWKPAHNPSAVDTNNAIAWSPKLRRFVALPSGGGGSTTPSVFSDDGINWKIGGNLTIGVWREVIWVPELEMFVAVADGGTPAHQIALSDDGENWTHVENPLGDALEGIAWSPKLHMLVALSYASYPENIITSKDGVNWTEIEAHSDIAWDNIVWADALNKFVVLSNMDGSTLHSSDGVTWERFSGTGSAPSGYSTLEWSNDLELFVALSTSEINRSMYSYDGISWTLGDLPDGSWQDVIWIPQLKLFVAASVSGADFQFAVSLDGIHWSVRFLPFPYTWGPRNMAWSPELGMLVATSTSYKFIRSLSVFEY